MSDSQHRVREVIRAAMTPGDVADLMEQLLQHLSATEAAHISNRKRGVVTHPIPFFGDLPNATVATVGLNPSATEFTGGRWPAEIAPAVLTRRLIDYFKRQPHPWFADWSEALSLIGASYGCNAVHVDVSPRATVNAGGVTNEAAFRAMLCADLPWMIRFLRLAPKLRLILMAGTATGNLYMNEFVAKNLVPSLGRLEGSLARPRGRAKVKHHVLDIGDRRIPVYFCSSSPSDRRHPGLLLARVRQNADLLRGYLAVGA
jgi:hypothetical protein